MQLGHAARDQQAETGAVGLRGVERIERAVERRGIEAGPVVGDGEARLRLVDRHLDPDAAAAGHGLGGVAQQVADGVREQARVDRGSARARDRARDLRRPRERIRRRADQGREVAALDAQPAEAGEDAEVLEELLHAQVLAARALQELHTLARGRQRAQQVEVHGEGGERVAELVQQSARHAAEGGQPLVLSGAPLGAPLPGHVEQRQHEARRAVRRRAAGSGAPPARARLRRGRRGTRPRRRPPPRSDAHERGQRRLARQQVREGAAEEGLRRAAEERRGGGVRERDPPLAIAGEEGDVDAAEHGLLCVAALHDRGDQRVEVAAERPDGVAAGGVGRAALPWRRPRRRGAGARGARRPDAAPAGSRARPRRGPRGRAPASRAAPRSSAAKNAGGASTPTSATTAPPRSRIGANADSRSAPASSA